MKNKKITLPDCSQLVVVISPDDSTITAKLHTFDKKDNNWLAAMASFPVNLGRTGLAPGKGIHPDTLLQGQEKEEGDGKSPAGIFRFGNAFGYARKDDISGIKLPYIHISETTQCIEDGLSAYYNQIIDNKSATKDWESADFMLRKDDLYKWGVFVEHNTPAENKKGSCIFMHLWRGPGKPTAGCTAMTEARMLSLLRWLDPEHRPLLVQLTEQDYPAFAQRFALPTIKSN